jgi:hypothetical protein
MIPPKRAVDSTANLCYLKTTVGLSRDGIWHILQMGNLGFHSPQIMSNFRRRESTVRLQSCRHPRYIQACPLSWSQRIWPTLTRLPKARRRLASFHDIYILYDQPCPTGLDSPGCPALLREVYVKRHFGHLSVAVVSARGWLLAGSWEQHQKALGRVVYPPYDIVGRQVACTQEAMHWP